MKSANEKSKSGERKREWHEAMETESDKENFDDFNNKLLLRVETQINGQRRTLLYKRVHIYYLGFENRSAIVALKTNKNQSVSEGTNERKKKNKNKN